MATVRELVTTLGFKVDESGIRRFDKSFGEITQKISDTTRSIRNFGRTVQREGLKLTAFVTLPLLGLGGVSLKTASDIEQLEIAFETMLGSAEKSKKLLEDLFAFVAKTPFELKDAATNARLLLGMGIEADKIIPTLKALGDVAAGLSVPLERIGLNFGQVRTQGRLTGAELRDFARAGVPIIAELAKILNVSEKEVKKLVSRGEVDFKTVEKAFINMTSEGGKFFNLMERQSITLGGTFSNLMDSVSLLLNEFGKMIDETFGLREVLRKVTDFISRLTIRLQNMNPETKKMIVIFFTAIAAIGPLLVLIGSLIVGFGSLAAAAIAVKTFLIPLLPVLFALIIPFIKIIAIIAAVGISIFLLLDDMITWMRGGQSVIGKVLGSFEKFKERVVTIFKIVRDIFVNFFKFLFAKTSEDSDKFFDLFLENVLKLGKKILPLMGKLLVNLVKLWIKGWILMGKLISKIILIAMNSVGNLIRQQLRFILEKIPNALKKIASFFGLQGDITNQARGAGGALIAGLPPQTLVGEGRDGTRTNNTSANVNVNLQIPMGTPEAQANFLRDEAAKSFGIEMDKILTDSINSNQLVEQ